MKIEMSLKQILQLILYAIEHDNAQGAVGLIKDTIQQLEERGE